MTTGMIDPIINEPLMCFYAREFSSGYIGHRQQKTAIVPAFSTPNGDTRADETGQVGFGGMTSFMHVDATDSALTCVLSQTYFCDPGSVVNSLLR